MIVSVKGYFSCKFILYITMTFDMAVFYQKEMQDLK